VGFESFRLAARMRTSWIYKLILTRIRALPIVFAASVILRCFAGITNSNVIIAVAIKKHRLVKHFVPHPPAGLMIFSSIAEADESEEAPCNSSFTFEEV